MRKIKELNLTFKKRYFILFLLLGLIHQVCYVFQLTYQGQFINEVFTLNVEKLIRMAIIFVLLNLSFTISYVASQYTKFKIFQVNIGSLRQLIANAIFRKNKNDFDSLDKGAYLSMLNNDTKAMENYVLYSKMNVIFLVMRLAAIIAIMSYFSIFLSLLTLVLSLFNYFIPFLFQKKYEGLAQEEADQNENFNSAIRNVDQMMKASFFSSCEKFTQTKGEQNISQHENKMENIQIRSIGINTVATFLGSILKTLSFGAAIYLAAIGKFQAGFIVAFFRYIQDEFAITSSLINFIAALLKSKSYKNKVTAYLPESENLQLTNEDERPTKLNFENLSYSYDDKLIFNEASGSFEVGKTYAIVGASGAGKSTFAKLISGFDSPKTGTISFEKDKKALFGNSLNFVTYVNQNAYLFSDTIFNNIDLDQNTFNKDYLSNMGFVQNNKILGHELEQTLKGGNLSGGEAQVIELCRALTRGKPFLIFDESFVSIDKERKDQLIQGLSKLKDTALIFISHHIEDDSVFDCILEVKGGKAIWVRK